MKQGAADFIVKPWENEKLEATVSSSYQYTLAKKELHQLKNKQTEYSRVVNAPESEFIGSSAPMQQVLNTVKKVAETDANILLLGENGTGKDLLAKLIHNQSLRHAQPFIKIDVGSLSPTLFESELFGHKKGAFTDAKEERIGRIELAIGGTLFIDEIGNLPLSLQVKLLSVLQNREITPIGGNKPIPIDVRLICATNQNIQNAVLAGEFREDLLYRINTVEIALPPLRMRAEDIPVLAKNFLKVYTAKYRKENKTLSEEAIRYLTQYSWPGNVRELQHAIERAVIMSEENTLRKNDFLLSSQPNIGDRTDAHNLDELERKTILSAIQKYKGNMSKVAKELGVGRTTLYRKITKYGLDK
jgi:DNA-binding NtrC family response regulator